MFSTKNVSPYTPLNTLKPFAENLWIVDGEVILMDFPLGITVPFSTRMAIIKLNDGRLWVHSPIAPDDSLYEKVNALGEVAYLIAPNSLHYSYLADWADCYTSAEVYLIPGLEERAKLPLPPGKALSHEVLDAWGDVFDMILFEGSVVNEACFFHRPSKTAILVDFIENFESDKVHSAPLRLAMKAAGIMGHGGAMPRDYRLTFSKNRVAFDTGIVQLLNWPSEKVIMAHGAPYEDDGQARLKRAFAWADKG